MISLRTRTGGADNTLKEAQILGESVLLAEARMGEMLASNPSVVGRIGGGREKSLPPGIDWKASHYAQQLARHPEAIEDASRSSHRARQAAQAAEAVG